MENTKSANHAIYEKNAIEFVTVAAETCRFMENASSFGKKDFMDRALKLFPLLYLKISLVDCPQRMLEDDELEEFVAEEDYETIRQNIANILGYSDRYLEVFTEGIELSEEGIASDISENIADMYQDLKNFLLRFQIGNEEIMNDAICVCVENFRSYWGQRLVNCLRALHNAFYNTDNNQEEDTEPHECTCGHHHEDENCCHEEDNKMDMKHKFFSHQNNGTNSSLL